MAVGEQSKVKIGSIVFLTLTEQENGGIAIVLRYSKKKNMYWVYRIGDGHQMWVEHWEMHVHWSPK
jgi:hypothetical protein